MLQLPHRELPSEAASGLLDYQREVDAAGDHAARVAAAKRLFESRNRETNPVFREVRRCLSEMCHGARRCMFCEDSVAAEVEHFRPKSLYPGLAFAWANFLFACGPCNHPKSNAFRVITASGEEIDAARSMRDGTEPPGDGDPLLVDPRREDPLALIELDLDGTFFFCPRPRASSLAYRRAAHTIELLGLNEREYLPRARRGAFGAYKAMLEGYVRERDRSAAPEALAARIEDIRTLGHWTVWHEMKRQRPDLFAAAPEALDW